MTNKNSPTGGRITGAMESSNFNTLINQYVIPATDSNPLFIGDFVKVNNTSEDGIPICELAAAGDTLRGVVVSFEPTKDYENITYRPANIRMGVSVCDDPNIEVEVQVNGTLTSSDVGKNAELSVATGEGATGLSRTQIDLATLTTAAAQMKIMALVEKEENELGLYSKVRAIMYDHDLRGTGGAGTSKHNDLLNLTYDTAAHGTGFNGFQRGTTNSTIDPTVTDDDAIGYRPGDFWANTVTDVLFSCIDASTGAAIWRVAEDLQKAKAYFVNKAGSDSNTGKTEDTAFATITKGLVTAAADTPSSTNQINVIVLGSDVYTEDPTGVAYVTVTGRGTTIIGNYIPADDSVLDIKRLLPKTTSPFRAVTKSSGAGIATVIIAELLDLGTDNGVQCTSGTLNIKTGGVSSDTGVPIPTGSTGTINWVDTGAIKLGVANFAAYNSAGVLNLKVNDISNGNAVLFNFGSGLCVHSIEGNKVVSADRVFDVGSGPLVHFKANYWEEVNASILTGNVQYGVIRYHRSGDTYNDFMRVRNDIGGFLFEAPDSGGVVESRVGGNTVAQSWVDRFQIVKDKLYIGAFGTHRAYDQQFVNLTTTPITTFTFIEQAKYFIRLQAPNNASMHFELSIGSDGTNLISDTILSIAGGAANGAVTGVPLASGTDGTYALDIGGYATVQYVLSISRTTGVATLETSSGTATDDTFLLIQQLGERS